MNDGKINPLQSRIADFAARHVATRPDLSTATEFPLDIWRDMGEAGLFKIGIGESHGGSGGGYLDLTRAGESFVQHGLNPGLALSWLYRQILARFIVGNFGTSGQQEQYMPALAAGRITPSFAVSEPGRGAHPKKLATTADRLDDHYELSGEKTYLTNGPIADLFIIVAVTGEDGPHRRFTAFLVPRATGGVRVLPPLNLNFLKPSVHGGVKLDASRVGPDAVLGREGNAWTDMVVPLGEIEDVVMMGPAAGGMAAQMDMLLIALRRSPAAGKADLRGDIGDLAARLAGMRVIAYEAAKSLDAGGSPPTALCSIFTQMSASFQTAVASVLGRWNPDLPDIYHPLRRDMESLMMFRKRVMKIRQEKIGAALLKD